MSKLTTKQASLHNQALAILENDILNDEQKEFVFINYQESATNVNSLSGAFFTPISMAFEFEFEATCFNVETCIDFCAGIGVLSYAMIRRNPNLKRLVCIDINPEYVAIGKKLVPEADWYCMDITDSKALQKLGFFDLAISNPPFGAVASLKDKEGVFYNGSNAEYKVIDIAGSVASRGAFIIPQSSTPYKYSNVKSSEDLKGFSIASKYKTFHKQTLITLDNNMGFDTSLDGMYVWDIKGTYYDCVWHGVNPVVEFVTTEYPEKYHFNKSVFTGAKEEQLSIFG
jgi:predicted RNA methylase